MTENCSPVYRSLNGPGQLIDPLVHENATTPIKSLSPDIVTALGLLASC